jgi:hypothetical protein
MSAYITNYDADTYFLTRFPSDEWDNASDENKTKALAHATRLIDTLNFIGDKHDETQVNEFPRGEDTVVPEAIANATCEIAVALISGRDIEYEQENLAAKVMSLDNNRLGSDSSAVDLPKVHGIPSRLAWDFLRPFLRDGQSFTISRVD